jgi:transglutaminase-like putative cysteine protease
MKYEVTHRTTYHYSEPVTLGHNSTHLTPRTLPRQRCLANRLAILPTPSCQRNWIDYFGNQVTYFTVEEEHRELTVTAISEVAIEDPPPATAACTFAWEDVRDAIRRNGDADDVSAAPYSFDSPCVRRDDRLASYAALSFAPQRPLLDAALELNSRIFHEFKYDPAATSVSTPTMEVFEKRRGVCQDFAHLEIGCLRSLGLAARYVSGYLLTDPRPGQPKLVGADASHAWLSIFCPGLGWVDFDPTNNVIPSVRHVTLAWGRDYGDVCPIKGVFLGGGSHWMSVAVDVAPA